MHRTFHELVFLLALALLPTCALADNQAGTQSLYFPGPFSVTSGVPSSVMNVRGLGARGDGSTDDTAAIQNAINAAGNTNCVYFPAGTYVVTRDLNFTSNAQTRCLVGDDLALSKILCEDTGGNCVDLSGSDGYSVRSLTIIGGTSAANAPNVALLLARTGTASDPRNPQGFGHLLRDVWVQNNRPTTIYDYGAELGHWDHVLASGVVISGCNRAGIQSQFQPINPAGTGTSMSAMHISNSYFNNPPGSGINGCAIQFDNACTNGLIHDINIWGTYWGEMAGGGTAMCDTAGGTNQVITLMTVIGTRLEAADGTSGTPYPVNGSYRFINFPNTGVFGMTLTQNDLGTIGQLSATPLAFGQITSSQIQVGITGGGMAPGVLALTSAGTAESNRILDIPPSGMSPIFYLGNLQSGNRIGDMGNYIQWGDGAPTYYGHVDAGGMEANTPTTALNGTTGGVVNWNMPGHALYYKLVVLSFQGYQNTTTTAQQIVYPVTFLSSPTSYGSCPPGLVVGGGGVNLPISMAGPFTGQCMISGQ